MRIIFYLCDINYVFIHISFLKSKNPDNKIGVLGIKHGANVLWQLSAMDKRVDASTFLFGAG